MESLKLRGSAAAMLVEYLSVCFVRPISHYDPICLSVCVCSVLLPVLLDRREWLGYQG